MSGTLTRRDFLAGLGKSGAALAAGSWLGTFGYAQTRGPARTVINQARYQAELDRRLLGASSSIWAGPSTPACTSRDRRWPTRTASAKT